MPRHRFRCGTSIVSLHRARDVRRIRDPAQARRVAEAVVEQIGKDAIEALLGQPGLTETPDAAMEALIERLLDGSLSLIETETAPRLLDAPKSTWLSDLIVEGPGGEEPTKPEPVPVAATLDVRVVSEAGSPLPGIELEIRLTNGEHRVLATAADGRCFVEDLVHAGECAVTFTQTVELGSVADDTPSEAPVGGIRIHRGHREPILLATDKPHTIVVVRPRVRVLELADGYFGEARKLLLFAPEHGHAQDRFDERVTARAVFRTLIETANDSRLLVAGHTDTVGGDADNQTLSEARARSVHLYLSGQRDAWAEHAQSVQTSDDVHATLRWVAQVEGVACEPSAGLGPALAAFRQAFVTGPEPVSDAKETTADDWRAVYDLYDRDLARLLHVEPDALAAKKATIKFVEHEPIGCGERQPIENVAKNGFESDANRRVDMLLFAAEDVPLFPSEPADSEIYGGLYRVEKIPSPGETVARIFVVDDAEAPAPAATVAIKTPTGSVNRSVGPDGYAEFVCLVGDTIEVIDARSQREDLTLWRSEAGSESAEG